MHDSNPISGSLQTIFVQKLENITGLPEQLRGDPQRQAVSPIQGFVYQAWWSIDAWLRLSDADEVIYLEGAEDFDLVKKDGAIAVQVKRNTETISLGTAKVHAVLENFWKLSNQEMHRRVDFHFLTTSSIAKEKGSYFGGAKGIEIWRAAQTNLDLVIEIKNYLIEKLGNKSPLGIFLASATDEAIQEKLIQRFQWITNQPDIDSVKQSVENRIGIILNEHRRPLTLTQNVQKYLESRFWEIIIESSSERRCLTRSDFLHQFELATTAYLPLPIEQIPDFICNVQPGFGLLKLLLEKVPRPPQPLLQRPKIVKHLEGLVRHRKVVLITGTVHKGKTTVAQLVSSKLCPEAWWINLTDRENYQVDNLLLALAVEIENEDCPSLIIIDDLDICQKAYHVYRDSLSLIFHRAEVTGRGILITAQGATTNSSVVKEFKNELFTVPEMSSNEIEALCLESGCPKELAQIFGPIVAVWTAGHPKLVQVRLDELETRNWPKPNAKDLTTQSSAVTSVRQIASQLLSESIAAPVAEFVYIVSECSVPIKRSIAIRIAESVEGLSNGGNIIDNLAGKWLEKINDDRFRTTALLTGIASEVWSPERRKRAHITLHDAILSKRQHDPFEAAALLFHAYIGGEPQRLAHTAMNLQTISGKDAERAVQRQLLWLPFAAIEPGQHISDDEKAGLILRRLQFLVAITLETETLPLICERWSEDISEIHAPKGRALNQSIMWFSTGFAESARVPLKYRLDAIAGVKTLPVELLDIYSDLSKKFFETSTIEDGLPTEGTISQVILIYAIRNLKGFEHFEEFLNWLDKVATEEIRQEFEAMLEWPLVQTSGAFVHGAWASVHEEITDWKPWLLIFERAEEYAKLRKSPCFGREAAKARAIILTEYFDQGKKALEVLDSAEKNFGSSTILTEQRANVLFHKRDDESVLEIWEQLDSDPKCRKTLDPFACRRVAISAARLQKWNKAETIFQTTIKSIQTGSFELTKFGLMVDSALTLSLGGNPAKAAEQLTDAALSLPDEALKEGNEKWEAVLRVTVSVCKVIEESVWKLGKEVHKLEPGCASDPNLIVPKVSPGQAMRCEMTRVQIFHLASMLLPNCQKFKNKLEVLVASNYLLVRWFAIEARLATGYSNGAKGGFIKSLLAFDSAIVELSEKRKNGFDPLAIDDGVKSHPPFAPERWFGLLCAGVICTGRNLIDSLTIWLDESIELLGEDAALTNIIQLFIKGALLPVDSLEPTILETESPPPLRCGAAARLLQMIPPAEKTIQIQAFLTAWMMNDEGFARQQLFNLHIGRCFADFWRLHSENSFQFFSPRTTRPDLIKTLEGVEKGTETLKSVLISAARALNQPPWEFIERVL